MRIRRMEQAGAIFTTSLSSVNDLKKRGFAITGNPAGTDGPLGKALDFDGTNDYITLGADIEKELRFDGSTQDFSISVWIRRDAIGVAHIIFGKRESASDGYTFFMGAGNDVRFILNDKTADSTATITDTNWHHVAVTADRDGNAQIYLDGSADGSVALASSSLATTTAPAIGARSYDNDILFNGAIKNLMIFDRLLTAAEITDLAQNTPFDYEKNVVSEWNMSDINPPDVGYRGLGNNGTGVSLTAASVVNGIGGGKAIEFDGSADYIDLGDTADVDFGDGDFSFSAWVSRKTFDTNDMIIGKSDGATQKQFVFFIVGTDIVRVLYFTGGGTTVYLDTTDTITYSNWHHIVGQRVGNSFEIYIDGVLSNSGTTSGSHGTMDTSTSTLRIGSREHSGSEDYFNGTIDKVTIFDKALTALEVADLYHKQRGGRR